jgi:hypothetical protein
MSKTGLHIPAGVDTARLRSLFMRMIVIEVVCVSVAILAFAGFALGQVQPLLWVFVAALLAGFGGQIWFVMAWAKETKAKASHG